MRGLEIVLRSLNTKGNRHFAETKTIIEQEIQESKLHNVLGQGTN